jgi:hypothetical protein
VSKVVKMAEVVDKICTRFKNLVSKSLCFEITWFYKSCCFPPRHSDEKPAAIFVIIIIISSS